MDDKSGDGLDKRNWRDRLGIGKNAGVPDMPKLADDFHADEQRQVRRPATRPAAPVAAAPMAPRTVGQAPRAPSAQQPPHQGQQRAQSQSPIQARPVTAAPRPMPAAPSNGVSMNAPVAPRGQVPIPTPTAVTAGNDALAQQLRDQREAAERLAHQRIQTAMNKAESSLQAGQAIAKPRFTFADEPPQQQPVLQPRPAVVAPTPQYVPQNAPQVQPTRAPLGGGNSYPPPPSFQQVGQQPPVQPHQNYQPGQYNNPYTQQPNPYRPAEQTAYVPPPVQQQYVQQSSQQPGQYAPQQQQPLNQPLPRKTMQPQLQQGLRPPMGQPPTQGVKLAPPQRAPRMPMGPSTDDDIFESASAPRMQRRATANDYQQAYRDELSYDDEVPKSRGLGTLLGLALLMVLVVFSVIFGYWRFVKQAAAPVVDAPVPVITEPATPIKTQPDPIAPPVANQTGQKQIYDRIEGDREVPGGALNQSEEVPAQNGIVEPLPVPVEPLPAPVEPGVINDQQGAISPDPLAPEQTKIVSQIPAVEPSSTANSSVPPVVEPVSSAGQAQTSIGQTGGVNPEQVAAPAKEVITDASETDNTPAAATKLAAIDETDATPVKKNEGLKTLVPAKKKSENLGSKPVVLVPAKKKQADLNSSSSGGKVLVPAVQNSGVETDLYGDAALDTPRSNKAVAADTTDFYGEAVAVPKVASLNKPKAVKPPIQPVQEEASAPAPPKGVRVELASFSSKNEALAEYKRLGAKHGPIISNNAPIVVQKKVLGVTMYQLNLGPMNSKGSASNVCASLFVAGERDCSVTQL